VDVEIDGSQHESDEHQRSHDLKRTDLMEANGIRVIRFSNPEVDSDLLGVTESIISFCNSRKFEGRTVEILVSGWTFGKTENSASSTLCSVVIRG
jgi:very-short-patch-repair endonuclease